MVLLSVQPCRLPRGAGSGVKARQAIACLSESGVKARQAIACLSESGVKARQAIACLSESSVMGKLRPQH